jgi:F-type H+-transporting ATPase subunit b
MLMNAEVWVLAAFLIFFGLFGGKIWGALAGMLDSRANSIRIELEEAANLRAEAETMLRDAQKAREAALVEAREIVARSRAEAARIAAAATAEAEAQAKRRERMALDRISAAEKAAITDVRQTAADIAASVARTVITETLTAQDDAGLVDHAIAGLPKALRAA